MRTTQGMPTNREFDMLHCHIGLICCITFILLHYLDMLHSLQGTQKGSSVITDEHTSITNKHTLYSSVNQRSNRGI
jgi:hypothetical protein